MEFLVKLLFLTTICCALPFEDLVKEEWELFKLEYGKTYSSEEEEIKRMDAFMENSFKIAKHNQLFHQGKVSFTLALNKFADMSLKEFSSVMKGYIPSSYDQGSLFVPPANIELPDEVDWRKNGAVTPVKNQEHCGSCWSFSTTGSLEGQHFLKTKKLVSLSEQNLVDCDKTNAGCGGGFSKLAFDYIKENGGIDTEKSYPYEAKNDTCRYNPAKSGATVSGYVSIKSGSEDDLKAAVATIGPISVAIDSNHTSFQLYNKSEIYDDPECTSEIDRLDHAVLVIGYGATKDGRDYWLVKNSWGTDWGNEGYFKMARNKNNACGVATDAVYPLV